MQHIEVEAVRVVGEQGLPADPVVEGLHDACFAADQQTLRLPHDVPDALAHARAGQQAGITVKPAVSFEVAAPTAEVVFDGVPAHAAIACFDEPVVRRLIHPELDAGQQMILRLPHDVVDGSGRQADELPAGLSASEHAVVGARDQGRSIGRAVSEMLAPAR